MTGRNESRGACKECSGKGRVGIRNAALIPEDKLSQVQVRNILNFLWNAEIISDDEHTDGHTFKAWRDQHRVSLGLEKPVSNELDEPLSLKLRAYGYVLLLKKLSVNDVKAINKSIDVFANYATQSEAFRERKPYEAAFKNLAIVIIPIREQISYLESISEEERALLVDEQLKKLLAQINNQR